MKYTRHYVEQKGRAFKQPPQEDGEHLLVNVLDTLMYVRKDDFSVTPCLINDGYWESWITTWLLNNLTPRTFFVDVGANTGYYSFIATQVARKTLAFEPNPNYVELLHKTNDLTNLGVTIIPKALSNREGKVTLNIPGQFEGSASIVTQDFGKHYSVSSFEVDTTTLDKAIAPLPVQDSLMIKVDAEGAEELIWAGATSTNAHHKPVWIIEYTPGAYGRDFLEKLEDYGNLMWINHDGVEEAISKNVLLSRVDWTMLVIRPRR